MNEQEQKERVLMNKRMIVWCLPSTILGVLFPNRLALEAERLADRERRRTDDVADGDTLFGVVCGGLVLMVVIMLAAGAVLAM
jgi:hypothetical protein